MNRTKPKLFLTLCADLRLFHSALAVPCLFVLDAYGIETFQPLDQNLVACLTINGIFGTVLSNVCEYCLPERDPSFLPTWQK